MEWWLTLLIIIGSLIVLMITGLPTAFCFMIASMAGVYLLLGGAVGLSQLMFSIRSSVATFSIVPVVMFLLMGEIMFESGVAPFLLDTVNKWLGRLPGRLSLVAVLTGTIFATLSGSAMASAAMLGSLLVPEMEKRGYKKLMSLGPVMGSGGLAMVIPPSGMAVFVAVIAEVSVGKLLMAIIVPGLLMAVLFAVYIVIRCYLQPELAPAYDVSHYSLSEKLMSLVKYVLPLAFIVFLVTGIIF